MKDEIEQYSDLLKYFQHLDLEPAEVSAYVRSIGDVLDYAFDWSQGRIHLLLKKMGCYTLFSAQIGHTTTI